MSNAPRFLILDGYPKESRDQFDDVGMRLAWVLYRDMLLDYLPGAQYDVWLSTDDPDGAPTDAELKKYAGVLWPGCNLTVYHDDIRSTCQLALARRAYTAGVPGFGSCWGIQVAAYTAGGTVEAHPKGREMGIVRDIKVTGEGLKHPMFDGKPEVFSHFVSHDDYISALPSGALRLAGNAWSPVQAAAITHETGQFWAVQYHPEYDLHELARLIVAREPRLVKQGLFLGHDDLAEYVDRLEALAADPTRTDLRWQLGIDDTVLDPAIRQREFKNWLDKLVLPRAAKM
ncbi:MAG: type 1 glutamine amidotransferase [FCB group bacterium]|jgi:GMP synthase (glutamine-hydrolysing)|nr:type 1 glutamine amidotransferase [FCB group bacterium]